MSLCRRMRRSCTLRMNRSVGVLGQDRWAHDEECLER